MATYYMRADGTAANKGAATSPDSASTAMSVATHNGETFSAGDIIYLSDQGGPYVSSGYVSVIIPPSNGSSGNEITYKNVSGETPVILSGLTYFSGWGDTGNGIWGGVDYAYPYPLLEYNINTKTAKVLRIGASKTSLNPGEYFYSDVEYWYTYWKPTSGNPSDYIIIIPFGVKSGVGECFGCGININGRQYIIIDGLTLVGGWGV